MEQKPDKKEELMLANNVLKLAADLLKVSLVHQVSTFINSKTFPFFSGIGKSIQNIRTFC